MKAKRWSPQEKRVLDTYVLAFARGKYRNLTEAVQDYQRNIAGLRRRYPHAVWLEPRRTPYAVRRAIQKRKSVLRLPSARPLWSAEENRILNRYAWKVAHTGNYTDGKAARDYLEHVTRLRRQHPTWTWLRQRRTVAATAEKIRQRSHELGRPYLNVAFSPREDEIFTRYARDVLAGRYRGVKQAADKARVEILRLHRQNPNARWAQARRSHTAVWLRIARLARRMGRSRPDSPWDPDEDRVVERYARAVARGRYEAKQVAGQCSRELERRRSSGASRKQQVPWAIAHRTLSAVTRRILLKAHALGWNTGRKSLAPEETAIVMRWARTYAASRWQKSVGTGRAAVQAAVAELARHGYRRTETACQERLQKVLRARRGMGRAG